MASLPSDRLGVAAAVVDGRLVPGDVVVGDGRVLAVGAGPAGRRGLAVPGFVDLQVNGFAGVDLLAADADGYATAGEALAATGVTGYLPTFISTPPGPLAAALEVAARAAGEAPGARVLGVHLEGPWLSPAWPGAHDPANLRAPDADEALTLLDLAPVAMVTLAPELPGALGLVRSLTERGVTVSCGHSDADAAAAHAGFDAGARAVTHLHNAHRRWAPRDPGLGGVGLVREDVTVQVIADGTHLAVETVRLALAAARGRLVLVSDAMAAAGLGDGTFPLGDRRVHVRDGAARLADGRLAGSVLTMDAAVRKLVALGATIPEAVDAATGAPARLLRRPGLGLLRPGAEADVVVLDDTLHVTRTLIRGHEAHAAA